MWFTRVLQYYKHRMRVHGKLFEGKNRIIPRLSVISKRRALNRLILEQDNLDVLSKPFLTVEEEHCHAAERRTAEWKLFKENRSLNMPQHKLMTQNLDHLNVTKKWE